MDRHQVSLGLLLLRVLGGGMLIAGRSWSWSAALDIQRLQESAWHGFGGELNWFLTLFSECLCTILFMFGVFTRFTAVPPLVSMLLGALLVPWGAAWSGRELFLLYALPFFVVGFTGPGDYSVDGRLSKWSGNRR